MPTRKSNLSYLDIYFKDRPRQFIFQDRREAKFLADPWSCFYDGVEGEPSSFLRVNLTTDGGWLDSELEAMADTAGLHWFNFIGCDFPEISTIVININGLDYNVSRFDVPDLCS